MIEMFSLSYVMFPGGNLGILHPGWKINNCSRKHMVCIYFRRNQGYGVGHVTFAPISEMFSFILLPSDVTHHISQYITPPNFPPSHPEVNAEHHNVKVKFIVRRFGCAGSAHQPPGPLCGADIYYCYI